MTIFGPRIPFPRIEKVMKVLSNALRLSIMPIHHVQELNKDERYP